MSDVEAVVQALRDKDCPYLGNYKLGYDAALDDVLRELARRPGCVTIGECTPRTDGGDGCECDQRADERDLLKRPTETLDEMERRALDKGIEHERKLGMFRLPRRWR